jgi:hypothetical protein
MLYKLDLSEPGPALQAAIGSNKIQETLDRATARSPYVSSALGTSQIIEFAPVEG